MAQAHGAVQSQFDEFADNDAGYADHVVRSQLAILEQIQRENEMRRKTSKETSAQTLTPSLPSRNTSLEGQIERPVVLTKSGECDAIIQSQMKALEKFRRKKEEESVAKKGKEKVNTAINDQRWFLDSITKSNQQIPGKFCQVETVNDTPINDGAISSCSDHCARFGKSKVLVRGTDHTYKAIQAGSSMTVSCQACGTTLQVPASAKAVFCTCCRHISAIESNVPTEISVVPG